MATLEEIDEACDQLSTFHSKFRGISVKKIYTFQDFYDSVCERIRSSGSIDDIVKEFESLHNDYQRSKLAMEVPEVQQLEICSSYCTKNADEAQQLEDEYDRQVIYEDEANKALQMISQSLKQTPFDNTSALSRRYMKRGWAALLLENFKAAKIDAERSLQLERVPKAIWNSHEILGHFYAKEGEFRVAEQHFQEAISSLRNSNSSNEEKARAAGRISLVYKNIKGRKVTKTKKVKTKSDDVPHLPKVAYGSHTVLESATEAVNVIVKDQKGRCLFTNKELQAGDVIIVEEPFAASLSKECLESHCTACFKRLTVSSVPCENCSSVWFCDEVCRTNESGPHSKECQILLLLNDNAMSKMATLVYRILIKQTWKKLQEKKNSFLKVLNNQEILKEITNTKQKYSSNNFDTIFNLVTNDDKRAFGDMFKRSLTGVFLAYCLEKTGFFMGDSNKENILYVTSMALRLLQGVSCNAYGITEYLVGPQGPAQAELLEIGGAVYPTISLTNHSCWPNASRYSVGTTCILRATRNIHKGSEVFDNYGQHFISVDVTDRQELLKSQYKFDCACEACLNSWSIYPHDNIAHLTFMCPDPNCRHPNVFVKEGIKQCSKCSEKKKFLALYKQINNNLSEFNRILNLIKSGKSESALKSLLEHQRFLDQHSVPPGKISSDTQEAIRQCFTSMGNSYHVKQDTSEQFY